MNINTPQIGLIGATGKAGSVILSEFLQKNIKVVALVRNPNRLAINHNKNLSIIIGDATDASKIQELVEKSNIIIDASNARAGEVPITEVVTKHLITKLEKSDKRLFLLAGKTIKTENDKISISTFFARLILTLLFPEIMKAKAESLALLRASSINWTMLRCPYIVDNDCQAFYASLEKCKGKSISKKSISAFILEEIDKKQYLLKAPFIYN